MTFAFCKHRSMTWTSSAAIGGAVLVRNSEARLSSDSKPWFSVGNCWHKCWKRPNNSKHSWW